ncbi:TPA: hypothetical protein N0F65_000224 [Lagenidium giganteum]|uniref:Uncharacterized protein n=1 Tax=Lagenidium giganteum TaxID=4803 RepID=A0AAV2YDZ6_9STRA|nr:TPA: hypothetical protein N0F65_000224 [Lagenidium giganteum]
MSSSSGTNMPSALRDGSLVLHPSRFTSGTTTLPRYTRAPAGAISSRPRHGAGMNTPTVQSAAPTATSITVLVFAMILRHLTLRTTPSLGRHRSR